MCLDGMSGFTERGLDRRDVNGDLAGSGHDK